MRLTPKERELAKEELSEILSNGPRTTGGLQGTQKFHGVHTLSFWQIRTLLRETGKVKEEEVVLGPCYSSTLWTLKSWLFGFLHNFFGDIISCSRLPSDGLNRAGLLLFKPSGQR